MAQPTTRRERRGRFVVVVGPDGAGKTTVARTLASLYEGRARYFHFRLSLRRLDAVPADESAARKPARRAGWRAAGVARLVRSFLNAWSGYLGAVRPAVRRGDLVIGDRWIYGYAAQPHALRFYGPAWLATLAVRLMPRPDLVANLVAAPDTIVRRKQEIGLDEAADELARWASLPVPRLRSFSTETMPQETAGAILEALRA